jgi:hypothetical protein
MVSGRGLKWQSNSRSCRRLGETQVRSIERAKRGDYHPDGATRQVSAAVVADPAHDNPMTPVTSRHPPVIERALAARSPLRQAIPQDRRRRQLDVGIGDDCDDCSQDHEEHNEVHCPRRLIIRL